MRIYVVDDCDPEWMRRLRLRLEQKGYKGAIADIYWFELPEEILTKEQREHFQSCGPYVLCLETGRSSLRLELLVRAKNSLRCTCTGGLTQKQRRFALDHLEGILGAIDP